MGHIDTEDYRTCRGWMLWFARTSLGLVSQFAIDEQTRKDIWDHRTVAISFDTMAFDAGLAIFLSPTNCERASGRLGAVVAVNSRNACGSQFLFFTRGCCPHLHALFVLWVVFGAFVTRSRPVPRWLHIAIDVQKASSPAWSAPDPQCCVWCGTTDRRSPFPYSRIGL